ncbi:unnamed protein product [Colias eurytheme]|nr:unnamed protein product [Colias eurytheme]
MNEKQTPNISKSFEETQSKNIVTTATASTSQPEEDVQSTARATDNGSEIQCSTKNMHVESTHIERDQMFVIVDSSCISNPSSRELLINSIPHSREVAMPKHYNRNVLPIGIPSTSKDIIIEPFHSAFVDIDSRDELQMIEINLQSESCELPIKIEDEEDNDSIVIAYLKNRDKFVERDGLIVSTKKKSSLLDDVPKMETILEDEQFASFVISQNISKISEHSLDLHIPSYPGSPRSIDIGSSHSYESEQYHNNPQLREAIEFLHADKDLLIAAETGNDQLLEIILRRTDTHIQEMDHLGRNALHLAVCSGNIRAVEILLKAGVNPNIKDSVEFVMMSTPTEEESKIMRLLVAEGALINDPKAPGGRQALHFAAMNNNCTLIKILMDLGAHLFATNHRNETPREVAATFDCVEAYKLLTELEDIDINSPSTHFFNL